MELITEVLTPVQFEQEISGVVNFLQDEGKYSVSVSYGWGCDLESEDLYQNQPVPLCELRDFIRQSIESGVFTPGEGDLRIRSDDEAIEFLLCHESHIHVMSADNELARKVASGWTQRGYNYCEAAQK